MINKMVINSYEEYNKLKSRMDVEEYIQTHIHRDFYAHPTINKILCSGVTFLNGETYIYSVSHKDAPMFEVITTENELNGKVAVYINNEPFIDIQESFTSYVSDTHTLFYKMVDINRIIPLTTWATVLKKHNNKILNSGKFDKSATYEFLNNATKCLQKIESAGLAVDVETFKTFFEQKSHKHIVNNLVYTQYHPYTMTGRPSNRFGSINFAALNKSDGSRAAFVSRFDKGHLVQLDFESYHLRLIGNYMGIKMPNEPIHTYLAKQYFKKENITDEEYEEGKQITFSILYGADVDTDIPLLNSIKSLSKQIYTSYLENEALIAPISGRKILLQETNPAENKLFNYFVQNYEFEMTVTKLSKLLDFLESKTSKLLLYTYDAVLLDCHPEETSDIIREADAILSSGGYPLRLSMGTNYDNLTRKVSSFDTIL